MSVESGLFRVAIMESLVTPKDLVLTKPEHSDAKWVVTVGSQVPKRLTPDLAKVLNWYQDGQPDSIDNYLGTTVTTQQLETATTLLAKSGLLVNSETQGGGVTRNKTASLVSPRFKFNSLFSIQFAILNKPSHFAWLERIAKRPVIWCGAITSSILAILGIILIFAYMQEYLLALTTPQTPLTVLVLLIFVVAVISVHEFAHALTLVYFGERVRRIGIMLFYFSPAFFCDITEAWKLPNKNQRTLVAFAGVISTFGIAGVMALIYAVTGNVYSWLAVATVVLYVESLLNLIPFIKLDGYIALMTYVDIPKLRYLAMEEWKIFLLLLISSDWKLIRQLRFLWILFGTGASATPIIICFLLANTFASASLIGSIVSDFLFLIIIILFLRGVYRIFTVGDRISRRKNYVAKNQVGEAYGSKLQRAYAAGLGILAVVIIGFIPVIRTERGYIGNLMDVW